MFLNMTLNNSVSGALFFISSVPSCWQHCPQIHNISDMWDASS